ncbi:hypothetical protein ACFL4T_01905 [candidate division KSB1 bacterium]
MKRFASIDIGSTSILLLILENSNGIRTLLERAEIANLGSDLEKTGTIRENNISLAVHILTDFIKDCQSYNVPEENIIITGTEILRTANNTNEFLEIIKRKFNSVIRILTGEEEATYSYFGQMIERENVSKKIAVLDIGGGSTEISAGIEGELIYNHSMKIGARRITNKFFVNDPPLQTEIQNAKDFIIDSFSVLDFDFDSYELVGVASTVTTACTVLLEIPDWQPELVHNRVLTIDRIQHLVELYSKLNINRKKEIVGLDPERASIILGGTMILHLFMDFFKIEKIKVSTKGLRYGILFQEFNKRLPD